MQDKIKIGDKFTKIDNLTDFDGKDTSLEYQEG
jgi:hypothetical protein